MLPIQISVDEISVTRRVADISISVNDDYRKLIYVGKPASDQVPISFVGMSKTLDQLQILDESESAERIRIEENSYLVRYTRQTGNRVLDLKSRHALITDVANRDQAGTPIPLFYRHVLDTDILIQPEVLDQDLNPVDPLRYKLLVENGSACLFHDLAPEVDIFNLKTKAYYIRYIGENQQLTTCLLESDPAYDEANILDWPAQDTRVYTVRDLGTFYRYRILYNGPGPFYVKITEADQLKLLRPILARPSEPWYIRVTDGEIIGTVAGVAERYALPEFHFQSFNPIEPISFFGTKECVVLNENMALAPFEHLHVDEDNVMDVLVLSEEFYPKFGFTSEVSDIPRYWVDRFAKWRPQADIIRFQLQPFTSSGVSVNRMKGLISLPVKLLSTDRVFVRASRVCRDFVYRDCNLNPIHNQKMLDSRVVFYLKPESEYGQAEQALHHLILDKNDVIKESSDIDIVAPVPGPGETEYSSFKEANPKCLILGTVSAVRSASVEDLTYIDVREPGGGLRDKIEEDILSLAEDNPLLLWVSKNSASNRVVPIRGFSEVSVPFSVLKEGGGVLDRVDVEEIVKRHMSLGASPLISYTSDEVSIVSAQYNSVTRNLKVLINTDGYDDHSWRLYYSVDNKRNFSYFDTETLSSSGVNNVGICQSTLSVAEVALMDLGNAPFLYVYACPLLNGFEWPPSKIVRINLTQSSGFGIIGLNAVIAENRSVTASLSGVIENE